MTDIELPKENSHYDQTNFTVVMKMKNLCVQRVTTMRETRRA